MTYLWSQLGNLIKVIGKLKKQSIEGPHIDDGLNTYLVEKNFWLAGYLQIRYGLYQHFSSLLIK